jgi:hypothetical protein
MTRTTARLATVLLATALVATACGGRSPSPQPSLIPALATGDRATASMGSLAYPGYPEPGRVEYRVEGTLPGLATHAVAYRLSATATDGQVARLAGAFGLTGAVSSDASGWTVTGPGSTLHVERTGGLPWRLAPTSGGGISSSGCAVAVPVAPPGAEKGSPAGTVAPPQACPSPTPVPGLPSRAEAERQARATLSSAGLDLGGATVAMFGGVSDWSVGILPAVAGVPLPVPWSVTVGPHGVVLSASGWLATPASAGDYPLVGVPAGVERLRQGGTWVLRGGPGPMPLMMGASGAQNVATEAAPAPQGAPGAPVAVPPPFPYPTPVVAPGAPAAKPPSSPYPTPAGEPCLKGGPCSAPGRPPLVPVCPGGPSCPTASPPPPVIVSVTGVHLGLGWGTPAGAAGGEAWLVPVYLFELKPGGVVAVIAVADRFVTPPSAIPPVRTLPEPVPLPAQPLPAQPPDQAPAPAPASTGAAVGR